MLKLQQKSNLLAKSNSSSYLKKYFTEQENLTLSEVANDILARSAFYTKQQETIKHLNSLRRASSSSQ